MDILHQILETKKQEVAKRKQLISARDLESTVFYRRERYSMKRALKNSSVGIIAEFKRKSPSKGYIHEKADIQEVVSGYADNGAAACSVLTDSAYFGGSLLDLALARKRADIPLLRKDFIVDAYQITEAAAYGADAVLLIAAALSVQQCAEYTAMAHEKGLEVLLEIHQENELKKIVPEVDMVGINNRNLATFVTDIRVSFELAAKIPSPFLKVAESGIHTLEDLRSLRAAGFCGFLIGERFMREKFPAEALRKFMENVD